MEIGTVIGNVWATKKHEDIDGQKLLVINVRKTRKEGKESLVVAADTTGAGVGDVVLVCRGQAARWAAGREKIPVDAAVVGIIDSVELSDAPWEKKNGGKPYGYQ